MNKAIVPLCLLLVLCSHALLSVCAWHSEKSASLDQHGEPDSRAVSALLSKVDRYLTKNSSFLKAASIPDEHEEHHESEDLSPTIKLRMVRAKRGIIVVLTKTMPNGHQLNFCKYTRGELTLHVEELQTASWNRCRRSVFRLMKEHHHDSEHHDSEHHDSEHHDSEHHDDEFDGDDGEHRAPDVKKREEEEAMQHQTFPHESDDNTALVSKVKAIAFQIAQKAKKAHNIFSSKMTNAVKRVRQFAFSKRWLQKHAHKIPPKTQVKGKVWPEGLVSAVLVPEDGHSIFGSHSSTNIFKSHSFLEKKTDMFKHKTDPMDQVIDFSKAAMIPGKDFAVNAKTLVDQAAEEARQKERVLYEMQEEMEQRIARQSATALEMKAKGEEIAAIRIEQFYEKARETMANLQAILEDGKIAELVANKTLELKSNVTREIVDMSDMMAQNLERKKISAQDVQTRLLRNLQKQEIAQAVGNYTLISSQAKEIMAMNSKDAIEQAIARGKELHDTVKLNVDSLRQEVLKIRSWDTQDAELKQMLLDMETKLFAQTGAVLAVKTEAVNQGIHFAEAITNSFVHDFEESGPGHFLTTIDKSLAESRDLFTGMTSNPTFAKYRMDSVSRMLEAEIAAIKAKKTLDAELEHKINQFKAAFANQSALMRTTYETAYGTLNNGIHSTMENTKSQVMVKFHSMETAILGAEDKLKQQRAEIIENMKQSKTIPVMEITNQIKMCCLAWRCLNIKNRGKDITKWDWATSKKIGFHESLPYRGCSKNEYSVEGAKCANPEEVMKSATEMSSHPTSAIKMSECNNGVVGGVIATINLEIRKVQDKINNKIHELAENISPAIATATKVIDQYECEVRSTVATQLDRMADQLESMIADFRNAVTSAPAEIQNVVEATAINVANEIAKGVSTVGADLDNRMVVLKAQTGILTENVQTAVLEGAKSGADFLNSLPHQEKIRNITSILIRRMDDVSQSFNRNLGTFVEKVFNTTENIKTTMKAEFQDLLNHCGSVANLTDHAVATLSKYQEMAVAYRNSTLSSARDAVEAAEVWAKEVKHELEPAIAELYTQTVPQQGGLCAVTNYALWDMDMAPKDSENTARACTGKPFEYRVGPFWLRAPSGELALKKDGVMVSLERTEFGFKGVSAVWDRLVATLSKNAMVAVANKNSLSIGGIQFKDITLVAYVERNRRDGRGGFGSEPTSRKKAFLMQMTLVGATLERKLVELKDKLMALLEAKVGHKLKGWKRTLYDKLTALVNHLGAEARRRYAGDLHGRYKATTFPITSMPDLTASPHQEQSVAFIMNPNVPEGLSFTLQNVHVTSPSSFLETDSTASFLETESKVTNMGVIETVMDFLPFKMSNLIPSYLDIDVNVNFDPMADIQTQKISFDFSVQPNFKNATATSGPRHEWLLFSFTSLKFAMRLNKVALRLEYSAGNIGGSIYASFDLFVPALTSGGDESVGRFVIEGEMKSTDGNGKSFALAAGLATPWVHPFGLEGVTIHSMGAFLYINNNPDGAKVESVTGSGAVFEASSTGMSGLEFASNATFTSKNGTTYDTDGHGMISFTHPHRYAFTQHIPKGMCVSTVVYAFSRRELAAEYDLCATADERVHFSNDEFHLPNQLYNKGVQLNMTNVPFLHSMGIMDMNFMGKIYPPELNFDMTVRVNSTTINNLVNSFIEKLKPYLWEFKHWIPEADWAGLIPIQRISMNGLKMNSTLIVTPEVEILFSGWMAKVLENESEGGLLRIPSMAYTYSEFKEVVKIFVDSLIRKIDVSKLVQQLSVLAFEALKKLGDIAAKAAADAIDAAKGKVMAEYAKLQVKVSEFIGSAHEMVDDIGKWGYIVAPLAVYCIVTVASLIFPPLLILTIPLQIASVVANFMGVQFMHKMIDKAGAWVMGALDTVGKGLSDGFDAVSGWFRGIFSLLEVDSSVSNVATLTSSTNSVDMEQIRKRDEVCRLMDGSSHASACNANILCKADTVYNLCVPNPMSADGIGMLFYDFGLSNPALSDNVKMARNDAVNKDEWDANRKILQGVITTYRVPDMALVLEHYNMCHSLSDYAKCQPKVTSKECFWNEYVQSKGMGGCLPESQPFFTYNLADADLLASIKDVKTRPVAEMKVSVALQNMMKQPLLPYMEDASLLHSCLSHGQGTCDKMEKCMSLGHGTNVCIPKNRRFLQTVLGYHERDNASLDKVLSINTKKCLDNFVTMGCFEKCNSTQKYSTPPTANQCVRRDPGCHVAYSRHTSGSLWWAKTVMNYQCVPKTSGLAGKPDNYLTTHYLFEFDKAKVNSNALKTWLENFQNALRMNNQNPLYVAFVKTKETVNAFKSFTDATVPELDRLTPEEEEKIHDAIVGVDKFGAGVNARIASARAEIHALAELRPQPIPNPQTPLEQAVQGIVSELSGFRDANGNPSVPYVIKQGMTKADEAIVAMNKVLGQIRQATAGLGSCSDDSALKSLMQKVTETKEQMAKYHVTLPTLAPRNFLETKSTVTKSKQSQDAELETDLEAELEAEAEAAVEAESSVDLSAEASAKAMARAQANAMLNSYLKVDSLVGMEHTVEYHTALQDKLHKDMDFLFNVVQEQKKMRRSKRIPKIQETTAEELDSIMRNHWQNKN